MVAILRFPFPNVECGSEPDEEDDEEENPAINGAVVPVVTHFTHIIIDIVPSKQVYLLFIIYSVSLY